MIQKNVIRIHRSTGSHWVGDGFPVHTLFSYHEHSAEISPFLLLDYASPTQFLPSDQPRGVGIHPHRGFETITIVYQGEVEHKDSAGHSGKIGPGDVQWMTAAGGILHEEMHSREFTQTGGMLEMVQLWLNLPAKDKMSAPHYQGIPDKNILSAELPDGAGVLRLIAGDYNGMKGAANTFTAVNLWDLRLKGGKNVTLSVPVGHNAFLLVLSGRITVNGVEEVQPTELVQFSKDGAAISFAAAEDSSVLFMSGEPIDEPVVGYGPFVMNTRDEIRQAINDYSAGRF